MFAKARSDELRTRCPWYMYRFCVTKAENHLALSLGRLELLILFVEQKSRSNAGAKDFRPLSSLHLLEARACRGWIVVVENNESVDDGVPAVLCEASAASEGVSEIVKSDCFVKD